MLVVANASTTKIKSTERDNLWLEQELTYLWTVSFGDIPRVNVVEIAYARFWKSRLGLITLSPSSKITQIKINGFLKLPEVPDYVARMTIAHELVHYAHGFGSPLAQRYTHPHRGGVVGKELQQRGLGAEHDLANKWVKGNWHTMLAVMGSKCRSQTVRSLRGSPNQEISDGRKVASLLPSEPGGK